MICTLLVLGHVAQGQETSTNEGGNQTCLADWFLIGDQCYWLSNQTLTFKDAKSNCEEKGAKLFEPKSEEENEQVHDKVKIRSNYYIIGIRYDDAGQK